MGPAASSPHRQHYPEAQAGGFSRVDGTVEFFSRVQALLPAEGVVVDLGAGRGKWQEDACAWRRRLSDLRGERRLVAGADVDGAVAKHSGLDAAVLLPRHGGLPFRDGSLSMVVADWVFEHVDDPGTLAHELARTVAPGAWVCARTPNRWGYVGLGARLVPNDKHVRLLGRLQPQREEHDVFAVSYRLNTLAAVNRYFPAHHWLDHSYTYNPDPDYVGTSRAASALVRGWQRMAPRALGTTLHVFLERRPAHPKAPG